MSDRVSGGLTVLDEEWIPLRDGRRLAARIWLPNGAADAPVPAILEYLPYRRRDGTFARDETTYPVFASAGYAGVRVDIAGNGDSDGLLAGEYLEDELATGEEVIAWIASQPWCSGAVGMIGISWGGFNGLQIAMRRPPALKAVVSACSTTDRYADDIHFMGGCLLNDNMTWSQQMLAYSSRSPDPAVVGERWRAMWQARLEAMPLLAAEWLQHQRRDEFWKHGSLCEDWSSIVAPVLVIGGWADAYRNTAATIAAHLHTTAKAVMGPWDHKYPHISRVLPKGDFHGEVIRWFDRWLKGEENGAEDLPAYRSYLEEFSAPSSHFGEKKGHWIAETEWPSASTETKVLNLSQGRLGGEKGIGALTVATRQDLGAAAGNFCPGMRVENELPEDQRDDDAASVCFDSEPLAINLDILGQPFIELEISSDKPVAFLVGRLCEVAPDGTSSLVSYRPFNLTHRDSHEEPAPLEPGKRYRVRFPLNHASRRLSRNNRLRLALSTTYWPMIWPAPETATVTLHLSECHLELPVRHSLSDERPDCGVDAPRSFPTALTEELGAPVCNKTTGTDDSGRTYQETFDDFGHVKSLRTGLETHSSVRQRFSIHPQDPSSAEVEAHWTQVLKRGDWDIHTETYHRMTSDATHFRIQAGIRAYEGDVLVHEQQWDEKVARDLL